MNELIRDFPSLFVLTLDELKAYISCNDSILTRVTGFEFFRTEAGTPTIYISIHPNLYSNEKIEQIPVGTVYYHFLHGLISEKIYANIRCVERLNVNREITGKWLAKIYKVEELKESTPTTVLIDLDCSTFGTFIFRRLQKEVCNNLYSIPDISLELFSVLPMIVRRYVFRRYLIFLADADRIFICEMEENLFFCVRSSSAVYFSRKWPNLGDAYRPTLLALLTLKYFLHWPTIETINRLFFDVGGRYSWPKWNKENRNFQLLDQKELSESFHHNLFTLICPTSNLRFFAIQEKTSQKKQKR